jgi:hypothetical protein
MQRIQRIQRVTGAAAKPEDEPLLARLGSRALCAFLVGMSA